MQGPNIEDAVFSRNANLLKLSEYPGYTIIIRISTLRCIKTKFDLTFVCDVRALTGEW